MGRTGRGFNKMDFVAEEGRQDIYRWYERRQRKYSGFRKSLHVFRIFAFNGQVLRSFVENFNFMVLLQMALAGLVTYACRSFEIVYDVHVSLFISPIVFPLAFSINTDFQRKEKVLDDLALFKSSAMMWIFCMRDWREACSFDDHYMKAIRNKIKGLMFHLREYLFTEKLDRRKFIVRVIYEDLSDTNQINEKVRCSSMDSNSPLVSRVIHFLNMMCLAFERLRVIREYRSPRSIRSFTKVLIFSLPILLSPYYVYLGDKLKNEWAPYYISTMVAFVFGALQGVQDKLDDPFDGMSEDDIKLDTLDEWTNQSLEATVHRTYKVGRFQVSSNPQPNAAVDNVDGVPRMANGMNQIQRDYYRHFHGNGAGSGGGKTPVVSPRSMYDEEGDDFEFHPYAGVLHNIKGNTTIRRGGNIIPNSFKSCDDLSSYSSTMTKDVSTSKMSHSSRVSFNLDNNKQQTPDSHFGSRHPSSNNLQSLFRVPLRSVTPPYSENAQVPLQTTPQLDFSESDAPLSGVVSYLLNMRLQQESGKSRSRSNSIRSNSSGQSAKSSTATSRASSPSLQKSIGLSNSKAEFFIGDSPKVTRKSRTPTLRRAPNMMRSLSMPESHVCVIDDGVVQTTEASKPRKPEIPVFLPETNTFDILEKQSAQDRTKALNTSTPFNKAQGATANRARFRVTKGIPSSMKDPLLSRKKSHHGDSSVTSSEDEDLGFCTALAMKPNNSFSINLNNLQKELEMNGDSSDTELANLLKKNGIGDTTC